MSLYVLIINFTRVNTVIYFIILNFFVLLIIMTFIFLMITTIKINNNNLNSSLPIYLLQFIIPFISSSFFSQIFYSFLTVFYCENNTHNSFFSSSYKCLEGMWFYIQFPLCIIAIIALFFIAYITNLIFYHPMCLRAKNKKINSLTDVIFLFTKIVMNVLFLIFDAPNDKYPLLILCMIFTGINLYCLIIYQGYSNKNLFLINYLLAAILFWGFVCLFISKIFNDLIGFNGTAYLFIIGIILILIYIFYKAKNNNIFFMIDKSKITSSIIFYKYILQLQTLIENKNKSRENKLILKSFLTKQEENCVINTCFLKKYLNGLSKGIDSEILLYYYMQNLFEEGLTRFNNDLTLTISYIYFLIKRLSKKKKALILYDSINKDIYSIDKLFNIYRCKKILETLWTGFDGKDKENIESVDIIKMFDYKNNVNKFKELLNKISLLYYDFWLALYSNNCEGKEEFKKLNDIGSKINKLLISIEESFTFIYCIKNDDIEILKLYAGYLKYILNNDIKFDKYHQILSNVSKDYSFETKEINYASFDISSLHQEKKEIEYFIIGASEDANDGKIINMSIGLSNIIGFQKHEIIGKDINILIPRIFHKHHNAMLKNLTSNIKVNLYQTLSNELKYTPEIITKTVYCLTKYNFLRELEFKAYLVQTEEGEHIYVVEIARGSSFQTTWNDLNEEPSYCVLTDRNFLIQTFTPNCCDVLGFNSNVINSNFEITSCIPQFDDEILNNFKENSNQKTGNSTYMFDNSDFLTNSNNNAGGNHTNKKDKKSSKNIMGNATNSLSFNNSSNKLNNIFRQIQISSTEQINLIKNRIKRRLIKQKYIYPQLITWKISDTIFNSIKYEEKKNYKFDRKYSHKMHDANYYNNVFLLSIKECHISNIVIGYYFFFKKIKSNKANNNDANDEINYYKRYISNTAEDELLEYKKYKQDSINYSFASNKQINKSSTERVNAKSGFCLTQQILSKDNLYSNRDNNEDMKNNWKMKSNLNLSEEENKNFSFYLISDVKDDKPGENSKEEKYLTLYGQPSDKEKLKELDNTQNQLNISKTFIPTEFRSFEFDIESMSYISIKEKVAINNIKEQNQIQINHLLNFYQKKINELHQNTLNNQEESSSTKKLNEESSGEEESFEYNTSSYYSSYISGDYDKKSKKPSFDDNKFKSSESPSPKSKKRSEKTLTIKEDKESFFEMMSPINRGSRNLPQYKGSSNKINKYSIFIQKNDFYKVKLDKIRYFYYDFNREVIIEDTKFSKISKMDKELDEFNNEEKTIDSHILHFNYKESNSFSSFLSREKNTKESKFKRHHSQKGTSQKNNSENADNNESDKKKSPIDNEKELENKIKEALNQEDKQKSISIFLIISVINLLILICVGILVNYYIMSKIDDDIDNIHLICYSAELRTFYNVAVYYLRELTLVNFLLPKYLKNEEYTVFPEYKNNKTQYVKSLLSKIEKIYIETHNLTESINSVDIPLSDNTTHFLKDDNITFLILLQNLEEYRMTTSLSISLVQLNSALYNLAITETSLQQNTTDINIFIRNFLFEVGEGIKKQIDVYIWELELRNKNKTKILIIGLSIIFILIIFIFVSLCISYKSIVKKKSSYIEGFYGIRIAFIRQALKNCEHYIYFLKKQQREDDSGLKHVKNSEISQNNEDDEIELEEEMKGYENFSVNILEEENLNLYRRNTINHANNKDSSSLINFSIIMSIYFLIIFGYYIMVFFIHNNFMQKILKYSQFIFHLQRLQNDPIDFFNGYREYLFDENTMIYGYNSEKYLQIKLEQIFGTKGVDTFFINSSYTDINNFKDTYIDFNKESLCSRNGNNYFSSEEECLNFLEGQIKYGYQVTSFTLIELIGWGINFIKYYFDVYMDIVGNLTEYGIKEYDELKSNQKFRLYLFNNDTSHSDINILFVNTLLPYYTDIVNITSIAIIKAVDNSNTLYLIFMICYLSLNSLLFLSVWLPFIKNMNSVIYNAKKILGIIPIQILSTLSNIKKILNLEKNKNS